MAQLVAADADDRVHGAVLEFCTAKRNLDIIAQELLEPKKRTREQIKTYTAMLIDEMQRANLNTLHVQGREREAESWIVLKPIKSVPRKLCAASIVEALRELSIEQLREMSESTDLSVALGDYIQGAFSRRDTGRFTLKVQRSMPREARATDAPPPTSHSLELARSLTACKTVAAERRVNEKAQRQPHEERCERANDQVQNYIKSVDPVTRVAPVQMEIGEDVSKFYLQEKQVRKTKSLTLKSVLPICLESFRESLVDRGWGEDITPRAVQRVRSEEFLRATLERIESRIQKYLHDNQTVKTELCFQRGLPRRRLRGAAPPEPGA